MKRKISVITILSIILVIVAVLIVCLKSCRGDESSDGVKVPNQNWISQPQLVYEGQWYFLKNDSQVDLGTLDLNYVGVLIGMDDLTFRPEDNFESNTHIGYCLFVDLNDESNRYVYVSYDQSIDKTKDISVFKR